jgi:hypothetical protein
MLIAIVGIVLNNVFNWVESRALRWHVRDQPQP